MIDSRFFGFQGPLTLVDIASRTGSVLTDPAMADRVVTGVAPLGQADGDSIAFALDAKRGRELAETGAGACFVSSALAEHVPAGCAVLVSSKPHFAWVQAAYALHTILDDSGQDVFVHATAKMEDGVRLSPGVVIGAHAAIGAGTTIGPGSVIGRGVSIGRDCRIGSNVSIGFSLIGDRVSISSGARLGEAGFGVAVGPDGPLDIPQLGRVIVQNGVSIGPNCCIDRGAWDDTVIGENSKLDNLVHIAHNVQIGRGCLIAGQTGIAGSAVIGDGVMFGGQVGVADHITIGDGASIGASGGVLKNVPAGEVWSGTPARPLRQWLREAAALSRLAKGRGTKGRNE